MTFSKCIIPRSTVAVITILTACFIEAHTAHAQRLIGTNGWKGVSVAADAAIEHNNRAYFFKGDQYQRFDFSKDKVDKVGKIGTDGWKGVWIKPDAALVHPNGKGYFFKGDQYQRFDFQKDKVDKVGKIGIDGWKGVWSSPEAAVLHPNGKAYFFKGKQYQRYDFSLEKVDKTGFVNKNGWTGLWGESTSAVRHSNGMIYFFKDKEYCRFNVNRDRAEFSNVPTKPLKFPYEKEVGYERLADGKHGKVNIKITKNTDGSGQLRFDVYAKSTNEFDGCIIDAVVRGFDDNGKLVFAYQGNMGTGSKKPFSADSIGSRDYTYKLNSGAMVVLRDVEVIMEKGSRNITSEHLLKFLADFDPTVPGNYGHETNKPEVLSSLRADGWRLIEGREISHADYIRLGLAAASSIGTGPGPLVAELERIVRDSCAELAANISGAPAQLVRELNDIAMSAFSDLFQGREPSLPSFSGVDLDVGIATFNRAEKIGGVPWSTPNTHMPYIRYRIR